MAAVLVGLAMLTSACTSATAGQPEPERTGQSSSDAPSEESTSAPDSQYSLARLCELLTPEEAQQLGGSADGEEGHSVSDGHTVCQWSDATTLVIGAQDGMTTANAETGPSVTNTPTTIDGLTAVQSLKTEPIVICQVLVDLPSGKLFTSAVSVLSAGEGRFDACQVATQLSNLIIPRVKDQ